MSLKDLLTLKLQNLGILHILTALQKVCVGTAEPNDQTRNISNYIKVTKPQCMIVITSGNKSAWER